MPVAEVTDLLRQLRSASGLLERGRVMVRAAGVFGNLSPDERRVVARALAEQGAPSLSQQLEERSSGRISSTQVRAISDGLLDMDDNQIDELTAKLSDRQEVGRLAVEAVEEGRLPTSPPSGPPVGPPNAPPTGQPDTPPTESPVSAPGDTEVADSPPEPPVPPTAQQASSETSDTASSSSAGSGSTTAGAAAAAGAAGASTVAARSASGSSDTQIPDEPRAAHAKVEQELGDLQTTDDLQLDDVELEAPSLGEAGLGEADLGEAGLGEAGPGETGPGEASPGEASPGEAGPGEAGPGEAGQGDKDLGEAGLGEADVPASPAADVGPGRAESESSEPEGADAEGGDDTEGGDDAAAGTAASDPAGSKSTAVEATPERGDARRTRAAGERSAPSESLLSARQTPTPSTSATSTSLADVEAVRERLEQATTATERLRIVADEASSVADAAWLRLLTFLPEGWQRRRAAERLVEAGRFPVAELEAAFNTLGNDRDATFVAGALIAAGAVDDAQLRGVLDDRVVNRLALRAAR